MKIPATGKSKDQIKAQLEAFGGKDLPWREGKTLAYIYDPGADVEEIGKWAYMRYLTENGLDPTVYPPDPMYLRAPHVTLPGGGA